jgi:dipeptidyl aminopeptidase/acylaminoacyl peptidase
MKMRFMIHRSKLMLPALLIALLSCSPVSRGQQPSDATHAIVQKIAYEAGWYVGSSTGGGGSLVEGNENQATQRAKASIYVADPVGSKPRWIDEGEYPTWSQDGARLAYCTTIGPNYGQIRIANADGKGKRQLTHLKTGACFPDWSPDGKEIAITLFETGSTSVAVVDENGTLLRSLGPGSEAHWSPDGKQILILRPMPRSQNGSSIWIMRADGSDAKEVLEDSSHAVEANWLPDGKGIVFASERDRLAAIYAADLEGKNVRRVVSDPSMNLLRPVESPDGGSIVMDASTPAGSVNLRLTVLQMDARTHNAKVLVPAGDHFSVFWGKAAEANQDKAEKKTPPAP